jgi:O-antigen ligase/polysaccharide polymerase Wzy-like membrane protein
LAVGQGRGAYIGFAVGMVVLALLRFRPSVKRPPARLLRAAAVMILAGGLGFAVLVGAEAFRTGPLAELTTGVSGRVASSLDYRSGTGAGRVQEYTEAVHELFAQPMPVPLVGRGTASWGQRHFHKSPQTAPYLVPRYIDGWYIRTLYDSGLMGFLLLGLFLGLLLWPTRAILASTGDLAPIARAFTLGAIVLSVAYAATDAVLFVWPWIVYGLTRSARAQATVQYVRLRGSRLADVLDERTGGSTPFLSAAAMGNGHVGPGP